MKLKILSFVYLIFQTILSFSEIQLISKSGYTPSSSDLYQYKNLFQINSFVETGTYGGETTELASRIFPLVYSIEIHPSSYVSVKHKLRKSQNIHLILGDSTNSLWKMIIETSKPRLYWLDAHYCGINTGGIPGSISVYAELEQIKNYGSKADVILIDDLRGFYRFETKNFPLIQIQKKIKEIDADFEFYILGDIGLAFHPKTHPNVEVSKIVKACSLSRLYDTSQESLATLSQLIDAEDVLQQVQGNHLEGQIFLQLVKWVDPQYLPQELGGEGIYLFWHGINDLNNGRISLAIENLSKALQCPCVAHWRMYAHLVKAHLLNEMPKIAQKIFQDHLQTYYQAYPEIVSHIIGQEGITHVL